jgi:hypothetical protein
MNLDLGRLLGCVTFALATQALANDSFAETGIGGITMGKTDKISMDSEKLFLSEARIAVEYEFLSHSEADEGATIAFPLPPVVVCSEEEKEGGHCNDDDVLGLEFETWIDGQKVPPAKRLDRVVVGSSEKDLSDVLKKHGLSRDSGQANVARILKLPAATRAALQKSGMIGPDPNFEVAILWQVQRVYYWNQTFKKGQRLKIRHQYRPLNGMAQGLEARVAEGQQEVKDFCIDEGTRRAIALRAGRLHDPKAANPLTGPTGYHWLKYILKSARSWAGPIHSFELTIEKSSPGQVISTCFSGLRKIDDKTFRATLQDFVPKDDLQVVFF